MKRAKKTPWWEAPAKPPGNSDDDQLRADVAAILAVLPGDHPGLSALQAGKSAVEISHIVGDGGFPDLAQDIAAAISRYYARRPQHGMPYPAGLR